MKSFIFMVMLSLVILGCHQPSQLSTQPITHIEIINDLSNDDKASPSTSVIERNVYVLSKQEISQLKMLVEEYGKIYTLLSYFNPVEDVSAQTFPDTFDYAKKEEIQQAYAAYQTDLSPIIQKLFDAYFKQIDVFKSDIENQKQHIHEIKKEKDKNEEDLEYSQKKSTRLFDAEMDLKRKMRALENYKSTRYLFLIDEFQTAVKEIDIKEYDFSIIDKSLLEDIYQRVLNNKIEQPSTSLDTLHLPVDKDYYFIHINVDGEDKMQTLNMKELRISINNGLYGEKINMSDLINYGVLQTYQPNNKVLGERTLPIILNSMLNL